MVDRRREDINQSGKYQSFLRHKTKIVDNFHEVVDLLQFNQTGYDTFKMVCRWETLLPYHHRPPIKKFLNGAIDFKNQS